MGVVLFGGKAAKLTKSEMPKTTSTKSKSKMAEMPKMKSKKKY